jgi:hypothetical protein
MQICKFWPIQGWMVNAHRPCEASCDGKSMQLRHALYFGDIATATDTLGMENRLTGYVFVMDAGGRIRWRESGRMLEGQGEEFMSAIGVLVQ